MYFCQHKGGNIPNKRSSEGIKVNHKGFLSQKYSRTIVASSEVCVWCCDTGLVSAQWRECGSFGGAALSNMQGGQWDTKHWPADWCKATPRPFKRTTPLRGRRTQCLRRAVESMVRRQRIGERWMGIKGGCQHPRHPPLLLVPPLRSWLVQPHWLGHCALTRWHTSTLPHCHHTFTLDRSQHQNITKPHLPRSQIRMEGSWTISRKLPMALSRLQCEQLVW